MEYPFKIGAPVFCTDGRAGSLDKIVIDPDSHRVTHLILRRGFLQAEDRVVPVEPVDRVTAEGIYLRVTVNDLERQSRYEEETFTRLPEDMAAALGYAPANVVLLATPYTGVPPPFLPVLEQMVRHGVPEGEIVLERGVEVRANGEVAGEIDHLLADPASEKITHLVVRLFDLDQPIMVPYEWVEDMGDDYVNLKPSREELERLPAVERPSDEQLATAVKNALERERAEAFSGVHAEVDRGVVRLTGTTRTVADKAAADKVARSVPGVIGVRNELLADTAIMARVTAALADDPRTALAPIEVSSVAGTVTCSGEVESVKVREAAEQIARQVPGVKLVVNDITVRPHEKTPELVTPPRSHTES